MAAAGTTTLDSLSDDVLGAIFLLLIPMVRCSCEAFGKTCRRTVSSCPGSAYELRVAACAQCPCSAAYRARRAGLVPRVCRRWHRITANASMWPDWCLAPRDSSVAAWLGQRSSGLRHLTLHQVRCWPAAATLAKVLHCGPDYWAQTTAALPYDGDRDQAMHATVPSNRGAPAVPISYVRSRLWRPQRPSCSTWRCSCPREAQRTQRLLT